MTKFIWPGSRTLADGRRIILSSEDVSQREPIVAPLIQHKHTQLTSFTYHTVWLTASANKRSDLTRLTNSSRIDTRDGALAE